MATKYIEDHPRNQQYYAIGAVRKNLQPKLRQAVLSICGGRELLNDGYVYDALCHFGHAANSSEPIFLLYENRCDWDDNQTTARYQRNYAAYGESQAIWEDAVELYDRLYGALKSPTTSRDEEMLAGVKSAIPGQVNAFHRAEQKLRGIGKTAASTQQAGA